MLSTFSCGGGSTMGYKLAGFDVVGCVEIDPQMMEAYRQNHSPRHPFLMGIQEFNKIPIEELPDDLVDLDVLDGSPPCSVFSTAGRREEGWGVEKKFREGQAEQRLDDLFFHFIEAAERLQPKVVVAENVTGMLKGSSRGYVKEILQRFSEAGYDTQLFQLNAGDMGVPQRRGRIFFIGRRRDLGLAPFGMEFSERPVSFGEATKDLKVEDPALELKEGTKMRRYWMKTVPGASFCDAAGGTNFTNVKLSLKQPSPTLLSGSTYTHPSRPRRLAPIEVVRIQSFPDDYQFTASAGAQYVCGMSVPPLMMQRIALRIAAALLG